MTIVEANKFYYLESGATRYIFDLTKFLESQGHQVIPFAMENPKNYETPYKRFFPSYVETKNVSFGLGALKTFGRMLYSFQAKKLMGELVDELAPNLCHIHNIYTQISPSILKPLKKQGVPIVMTVHDYHLISPDYTLWASECGPDISRHGLFKATFSKFRKDSLAASFAQTLAFKLHFATRVYQKNVDRFICPSEFVAKKLLQFGFDENKVVVNHYGIDLKDYEPSYNNNRYLLYFGRLSHEKGLETIVHMANLLTDIDFKIVGQGPLEGRLHSLVHDLPNVELLGFKIGEELQDIIKGSTGVLLPSRWEEVFGLSLLEAMAYGKPVIASQVGGIPEIVEDRVSGFLVKPLDLHGWVEAAARLFHDDELRQRLGRNARERVEEKFRSETHYDRLMHIYESAIAENLR